jgi:GNAT superfamily N-acetyltransferase
MEHPVRTPRAEIRKVGRSDAREVVDVMLAAFHDDPVVSFIEPRPSKRGIGIGAFADAAVRLVPERREVYMTADGAAAAIWSPPDEWEMSTRESLPFLRALLRTPLRLPVAVKFLTRAERMHPDEPHWYLDLVGTRPERQGEGIGAALLRPVLDRCDEEGLPVWTYSSNRQNLAFYHRLGFEVLDEVVLMRGAPTVFPIYRRPQA